VQLRGEVLHLEKGGDGDTRARGAAVSEAILKIRRPDRAKRDAGSSAITPWARGSKTRQRGTNSLDVGHHRRCSKEATAMDGGAPPSDPLDHGAQAPHPASSIPRSNPLTTPSRLMSVA
jgi:hypothetical protein